MPKSFTIKLTNGLYLITSPEKKKGYIGGALLKKSISSPMKLRTSTQEKRNNTKVYLESNVVIKAQK